jgi:hypothetical protein
VLLLFTLKLLLLLWSCDIHNLFIMGKIKHDDSENEMDVEGDNNRMH